MRLGRSQRDSTCCKSALYKVRQTNGLFKVHRTGAYRCDDNFASVLMFESGEICTGAADWLKVVVRQIRRDTTRQSQRVESEFTCKNRIVKDLLKDSTFNNTAMLYHQSLRWLDARQPVFNEHLHICSRIAIRTYTFRQET